MDLFFVILNILYYRVTPKRKRTTCAVAANEKGMLYY